jgi:4-oxalocrotonate tautomerase
VPIVTITMLPGCSQQEKRRLVAAITKDMQEIVGVNPKRLYIVMHETPKASWGMEGQLLADLPWAKKMKNRR